MNQKIIILDSGILINFILNGITDLLADLKKQFKGKFIITSAVKYEVIDKPLKIKRFELSALKINELLKEKVIELPSSIGISENELKSKAKEILNKANNSYFAKGKPMHIIDDGEATCLALSLVCKQKNMEAAIGIDERTTRMIVENPGNLRKLFESKLHTKIELKNDFNELKDIKFIRSAELVYVAYKKGLIKIGNGNLLDALLYAVKYKGCSISRQEIDQAKRI